MSDDKNLDLNCEFKKPLLLYKTYSTIFIAVAILDIFYIQKIFFTIFVVFSGFMSEFNPPLFWKLMSIPTFITCIFAIILIFYVPVFWKTLKWIKQTDLLSIIDHYVYINMSFILILFYILINSYLLIYYSSNFDIIEDYYMGTYNSASEVDEGTIKSLKHKTDIAVGASYFVTALFTFWIFMRMKTGYSAARRCQAVPRTWLW